MLIRYVVALSLILCCHLVRVTAQTPQAGPTLEVGKQFERELAPGESHSYPLKLSPGEFMRVIGTQTGINISMAIVDADSKEIWEANFSNTIGTLESLSFEAVAAGEYRVIIRPVSKTAPKGSYQLQLEEHPNPTADDNKRIAAERLLMDSLKDARQSDFSNAIEKGNQVLPLWRELKDAYWEADTLSLLGSAHNGSRKFQQAGEYYNQTLLLRRQIKDRAGESNAVLDLGTVAANLEKYEESRTYGSQALGMKRELKDRAGEARSVYMIANATFRLGKFTEVIPYCEQLKEIYQSVGDRVGVGNAYNLEGNCYFQLGQPENAAKNYEKAIELFRETKSHANEGFVLHNLGLIKLRAGDHDAAEDLFKKALVINRESKDRINEGTNISSLGSVLTAVGDYETALKYLEDALALARELKNRSNEADALVHMSSLYSKIGQRDKALETAQAALLLAQAVKSPLIESWASRSLADIYIAEGSFEKVVEYEEKSLAAHRSAGNRSSEADDLLGLAIDYRHLGRYDIANDYLQQALSIAREIKSQRTEAFVLTNIGALDMVQRNYKDATGYLEKALPLFHDAKLPAQEGRDLINLGESLSKLGRYQESIDASTRALAVMREVKDRDGEAIVLVNLATACDAQGQTAQARQYASQSLEIARELKDRERLRDALNELARIERNQGNLGQATAYLEQSQQSLEHSRSEIYDPQSRATFLAAEQDNLRFYIDLLMQRRQKEPSFAALAFEASERGRARVLLELLGEGRINIRQGVDPALLAQEQILGQKVNIWAGRLEQATKPELVARLKEELSRFQGELERTQTAIREASPQYAALTHPQPLKLKEIQSQLDGDTLLLEFSLGEERSYLWAIGRDSLSSFELPKAQSIESNARQVYEMLTARSLNKRGESVVDRRERVTTAEATLPKAAQELSRMLLAPVASQLGNKRLVIVAEGALQYIPFAMLPEPEVQTGRSGDAKTQGTDRRVTASPFPRVDYVPLIVNHELVVLPSASALAVQRAQVAGRPRAPKLLAVFADPVFDRTDVRFTTKLPAQAPMPATSSSLNFNDSRSIEHLAAETSDKSGVKTLIIPRLPYTRQEANQILALAPKSDSFSAMDFQANRATVIDRTLSQYRYVHFATHGLLDSERPGLSSLVLSMVDQQGKPQDGFLRANDIYNLKLPAELVVLSACQTGLGQEIKGEGLVGLTRGFMYAGASRVVVSLWSVNDKATAQLMTRFYEKMLKENVRPAAALRTAQVEMWKQKQWQSPYYWAAFTMQGEWR